MRKMGEDFRPVPEFKTLQYVYTALIFIAVFVWWYIPLLILTPLFIVMFPTIIILVIFLPTLYWIPKYYRTIVYRLTDKEIVWRRGVWFKNTGIVPYNRITNVDIAQGPVSRKFGIASLKIQTAGYSAPSARTSEIRIEGMKNFEELRETMMAFVRGRKPVAVETYEEGDEESRILGELVKIRKLLEKHPRR
jgi:membrane protein YdbS with pleckstrin-like domain